MSFQQGLSGLNNAAKNLDIIGNNVANANTVGFKGSRALFADVYANSLTGSGAGQVGIGTKVANIQQQFTQGNITVSNNPLDIAINGQGFFRMLQNGTATYSRNGQFELDNTGYVVNSEGRQLTGYPVDPLGNVVASAPVALQISSADISPSATTAFDATVNLDSRASVITAAFVASDPTTYTSSTAGTVYDTLGNPHVLTLYFVKNALPRQWDVYGTVDGTAATNVDLGAGAGAPATLDFDSAGALTAAMPLSGVQLTVAGGAATPLVIDLDLAGSTQYGADFGVNAMTQDGFTSGRLTGFNVGVDGTILGLYSNGQSKHLGQVVLANFANPQGLHALGNNQWEETADSGLPIVGAPGSSSLGVLQSSAVEDSNIDLTQELVGMITAQRVYQANAQSIKVQDEALQTMVNLR